MAISATKQTTNVFNSVLLSMLMRLQTYVQQVAQQVQLLIIIHTRVRVNVNMGNINKIKFV